MPVGALDAVAVVVDRRREGRVATAGVDLVREVVAVTATPVGSAEGVDVLRAYARALESAHRVAPWYEKCSWPLVPEKKSPSKSTIGRCLLVHLLMSSSSQVQIDSCVATSERGSERASVRAVSISRQQRTSGLTFMRGSSMLERLLGNKRHEGLVQTPSERQISSGDARLPTRSIRSLPYLSRKLTHLREIRDACREQGAGDRATYEYARASKRGRRTGSRTESVARGRDTRAPGRRPCRG